MSYIEISNPSKYKAHYNTKVKATALVNIFTVTINQPSKGGKIRVIYNGLAYTNSFTVVENSEIEILLDLDPGYTISGFTFNEESINSGYRTTVSKDSSITANLAVQQFTVQILNDKNSRINAKCNGNDNYVSFNAFYNDTIEVLAEATTEGYTLDSLLLNDTNIENGYTFNIIKNITIKSLAAKKKFTITVEDIPNCTVTIVHNGSSYTNGDSFEAEYGDTITITVTPDEGYTIDGVLVNGETIEGNSYIVKDNISISASVSKNIYTVHIVQPENANIVVQENGLIHREDFQITHGTNILIVVEITGGEDFYLDKLFVDGKEIKNNSYYEVVSNITLTATIGQIIHIPDYSIRINQSKYALITATNGDTSYTSSFTAQEGSTIGVTCETNVKDYMEITAFSVDDTNYVISDKNSISTTLPSITDNHVIASTSKLKDILMSLSVTNGKLKSVKINDVSQTVASSYNIHYQDKVVIEVAPYDYFELDTYTNINGLVRNGNIFTFNSYNSGANDFSINFAYRVSMANLTLTIPTGVDYIIIDGTKYYETTTISISKSIKHSIQVITKSGYALTGISGALNKSFSLSSNTTNYSDSITIYDNSTLSFTTDTTNSTLNITIPTGVSYITIDGSRYTSSKSISLSKLTSHTVQIATKPGYVMTGINGIISKTYTVSNMTQSYNGSFNISGNNSLGVTVSQLNITLNITQSTGGTISVNGYTSNTTIPAGTNFTIAITPAANYKFNYVQIDGVKYYEGNTIPSSVLTATYNNISVSANFILMRTVRLDQSNHATLSIQGYTPESDGSYKIPNNTTITIVAVADEGYEVTGTTKK